MAASGLSPESMARLERLDRLAAAEPSAWPTRDRILLEAARLIAVKGFHGATTRDIADAVGIQQPSIFNHFASKAEIVAELYEYDLVVPTEMARVIFGDAASPACRLYRYVRWQTEWYRDLPFDLRGLHDGHLEELSLQRALDAGEEWRHLLARLVEEGVAARQFHPDGLDFLDPAIAALAYEVVRMRYLARPVTDLAGAPEQAATFVLRAVLRTPASLGTVRREAARRDAATVRS